MKANLPIALILAGSIACSRSEPEASLLEVRAD